MITTNADEKNLNQIEASESKDEREKSRILPSGIDDHLLRYAWVYLLCLYLIDFFVVADFAGIPNTVRSHQSNLLNFVGLLLVIWSFNAWRAHAPLLIEKLFRKDAFSLSDNKSPNYGNSWDRFRADISSPKKYIPIGVLMLIVLDYYVSTPGVSLPDSLVACVGNPQAYLHSSLVACIGDPSVFAASAKTTLADYYVLAILNFGSMYFVGLMVWLLYASGWHIRSWARDWRFNIEPLHPDQCGGFKPLGDFCLGALYPIVVGVAFFGTLVVWNWASNSFSSSDLLILILLLVTCVPGLILVVILPLWTIHEKMVSEREENEAKFLREIEPLTKKIEGLLYGHVSDEADVLKNKLGEAKVLKEKKELIEGLYTPYPTLPFHFHWVAIGSIASLLYGTFSGVLVSILEHALIPPGTGPAPH